jgi:hypothetical protein
MRLSLLLETAERRREELETGELEGSPKRRTEEHLGKSLGEGRALTKGRAELRRRPSPSPIGFPLYVMILKEK